MKKIFLLLLVPFLIGAAPTRPHNYSSGSTISSTEVNANENTLYNYLIGGVDTIEDGVITNDDIHAAANIQASKLNLTAIAQSVANTGTLTNTGRVSVVGSVTATGLVATTSIQLPFKASDPCTTLAEGTVFWNNTSNIPCYCDGTDDKKFSDNSACF